MSGAARECTPKLQERPSTVKAMKPYIDRGNSSKKDLGNDTKTTDEVVHPRATTKPSNGGGISSSKSYKR